ncbi:MAG: GNAT family N-acetyltransferase [Acidobacteriota bacterium]|nr:GNAT family N-acetyltransferase [Acidobacteriota bacterium]
MKNVELETERLLLRQWRLEDFETYEKMCADEEIMRYIGGKALNCIEAWRHMAYLVGHWELLGYGHFAVEEKASGKFAGRIGFLNPAGWPAFEIGWTLAREFWGQGYAIEGARRALTYAFEELDQPHVISLIHPENKASIRVAERLGEKVEGQTKILGIPVLIYGIDRPVDVAN